MTNTLAVKTCGREDFERGLFDEADREAMDKENVNMHATMKRGFTTSALITIIMFVTSIFVSGGNAWFGISAGTLVMMFTYTYNLTMRFNYFNSMASVLTSRHSSCTQFSVPSRIECRQVTPCRVSSASG